MYVKPLIATAVAITITITDVAKRIPAVREDRKREDTAGQATIRAVVRSQSIARGFARAIKLVEERLRNVSQPRREQ
jgi:phosphopantothenate synthetase